ncbi:Putative auto-transporter adhesin, head GIN domain [Cnuella takakiae]|uniref:Putative auto-transporter adhesin, head GIN domain n=1 Tax=Cnuella takakiae TaxID=1302690 RepID=A0A1M5GDZ5_9BACT|nr:head GIN domain-containing protein [Cnuella takakiae]SHG01957.1 Putative auto-transporter adhesin, head GIN domain [Cnuella takakiae]
MYQNKLLLSALLGATLLLGACEKEKPCDGNTTRTYTETGFSRIVAGSAIHLNITKGQTFSISAQGCNRDIDDLRLQMKPGNTLEFDFERNRIQRDVVEIDITLPQLSSVVLSGAAEGEIKGFENNAANLRMVLSGGSKARVEGTSIQTQFDLSGASRLWIKGQTNNLFGTLSGGSELQAAETTAIEVDISASGGAQATVHVSDMLFAEATRGARIRYKGNPGTKEIVTSGGGQVEAY